MSRNDKSSNDMVRVTMTAKFHGTISRTMLMTRQEAHDISHDEENICMQMDLDNSTVEIDDMHSAEIEGDF